MRADRRRILVHGGARDDPDRLRPVPGAAARRESSRCCSRARPRPSSVSRPLDTFAPAHLAFLEQLTASIGIRLNSIESDDADREPARAVAAAPPAELQAHRKELQQTNEQLAQKAQQLAEQNAEVERKNQEIEQARRARSRRRPRSSR